MYRLYRSRSLDQQPTCGIVLLDEAFGKMDEARISATLTFARKLGLQLVLATPKERSDMVAPLVERSILIHKDPVTGQVVAAFYVYESQMPAVSTQKARGLKKYYGASDQTCRYFTVHASADTIHSQVWHTELSRLLAIDSTECEGALKAAEASAIFLWEALDGIERACLERLAN